ncbi:hypothetical protein LBMAG53_01640 [Planctomycetota bacterium]|nr:hypothetical protein LBMAG53_01640 [Planctomycetota bacterium]
MRLLNYLILSCLILIGLARLGAAEPILLWDNQTIAAVKARESADPATAAALKAIRAVPAESRRTVDNLFLIRLDGDAVATAVETAKLAQFVGCPPYQQDNMDWQWHHVDHWEQALRYDVLQDGLEPGLRRGVAATLRAMGVHGVEAERIRSWHGYPRLASHALCALATRDVRLIDGFFTAKSSIQDLIDTLDQRRFPRGQPGAADLTLGHLLLWCEGCRHLGLDRFGYGYAAPSGATMRDLLLGALVLIDPPVNGLRTRAAFDQPSGPGWPANLLPAAAGPWWIGSVKGDDNGELKYERSESRAAFPLALELAHRAYPDAGFGGLLYRLRPTGATAWQTSPYFGLPPITSAAADPPPEPVLVAPAAGLGVVRVGGWDGAMAVLAAGRSGGLGLSVVAATINGAAVLREAPRGERRDSWESDPRRRNGLWATGQFLGEAIDNGRKVQKPTWPKAVPSTWRQASNREASFVAATTGPGVYAGCAGERALLLTSSYLVDCSRMTAEPATAWRWFVHRPGRAETTGWTPADLDAELGLSEQFVNGAKRSGEADLIWSTASGLTWIAGDTGRSAATSRCPGTWIRPKPKEVRPAKPATIADDQAVTELELLPAGGAAKPDNPAKLGGPAQLSSPAQLATSAEPPPPPAEPGTHPGSSLVIGAAPSAEAIFVAVHSAAAIAVRRLAAPPGVVHLAIGDDRVAIALGSAAEREQQVSSDGIALRFTGFVFLRRNGATATTLGNVAAVELPAGVTWIRP